MFRSPNAQVNRPATARRQERQFNPMGAYQPLYHLDIENRCPGCGKSHWYVGRSTAECAYCETALPLAMVASQPTEPRFLTRSSKTAAPLH